MKQLVAYNERRENEKKRGNLLLRSIVVVDEQDQRNNTHNALAQTKVRLGAVAALDALKVLSLAQRRKNLFDHFDERVFDSGASCLVNDAMRRSRRIVELRVTGSAKEKRARFVL